MVRDETLISQPGWPENKVKLRVALYMEAQKQRSKKSFVGTRGRTWEDFRGRMQSDVV